MNVGKSGLSIAYLIGGVILLSIVVSSLVVFLYGPQTTQRTVVVESPLWNNYRGWWGYYGAGLPGWGGPKYPSSPAPHPKPPKAAPPPPPPPQNPAPANPPPANPPPA